MTNTLYSTDQVAYLDLPVIINYTVVPIFGLSHLALQTNFSCYAQEVDLMIAYMDPYGNFYTPDYAQNKVVQGQNFQITTFKDGFVRDFNTDEVTYVPGVWWGAWLLQASGGDWTSYELVIFQIDI